MKFNMRRLAEEKGEYVLGLKDLGTHAVYANIRPAQARGKG